MASYCPARSSWPPFQQASPARDLASVRASGLRVRCDIDHGRGQSRWDVPAHRGRKLLSLIADVEGLHRSIKAVAVLPLSMLRFVSCAPWAVLGAGSWCSPSTGSGGRGRDGQPRAATPHHRRHRVLRRGPRGRDAGYGCIGTASQASTSRGSRSVVRHFRRRTGTSRRASGLLVHAGVLAAVNTIGDAFESLCLLH
jgi:hypothetical protein